MSNEKLSERVSLFRDALKKEKKPERVPIVSNCTAWAIYDSGMNFSKVLNSYELLHETSVKFYEKYEFDAHRNLGIRYRHLLKKALESDIYKVDDDRYAVNILDSEPMRDDEYDKFIEKPEKLIWENFLPRKYPALQKENNMQIMKNTLSEFQAYGQFGKKLAGDLENIYGVPRLFKAQVIIPMEFFFVAYRGIKGLSMDLRRNKGKLKDALEAQWAFSGAGTLRDIRETPTDMTCAYDYIIPMLAHTVLNPKQFEELYWPYMKLCIEEIAKQNKTVYVYSEGDMMRYCEYFQDIPKGVIVLYSEMDDIFEIKKKMPNVAISGGFPLSLLGRGTVQECKDYAKKLIDELAYDGGYLFSTDKTILSPGDCKAENLKAVYDFVKEYSKA